MPLPDNDLGTVASDSGLGFGSPATPGESLEPTAALDPSQMADPYNAQSAALPETDLDSNSGDFSTTLDSLPRTGGNSSLSPGIGGAWPVGFANAPGNMSLDGGLLDDLRAGFGFSASLSGTYDTNPSQGYGRAEDSGQGDFYMTLGGSAAYQSVASTWTYGATYAGSYSHYFSQSDLGGYNQNAGASLNYQGGPLTAGLNFALNFGSGANRYYASVVDEISYSHSLNARYLISKKTSLTGDFSQRLTSASGDVDTDTDSFDLGLAALWIYSPLTEFGPGVRYTSRSGDSGQDRTSIGPTLTVNYELAKKVSLNSRVGLDFVEYEGGENPGPSWSTSIGLNYRASSLWGMNLTLLRDAQASYTSSNDFEEVTALRLGYNRTIRRASWTVGMGWETRSSDNPDNRAATSSDRDYLSFDTALSMPVFANTSSASIFMRYSDQGGDPDETWDSFQSGFSISRSF